MKTLSMAGEGRKRTVKQTQYKAYDDLPLMLPVPEIAAVLGISRAGAYELARSHDFPSIKIGSRIVIPKEKFISWIDCQANEKKP